MFMKRKKYKQTETGIDYEETHSRRVRGFLGGKHFEIFSKNPIPFVAIACVIAFIFVACYVTEITMVLTISVGIILCLVFTFVAVLLQGRVE